MKTVFLLVLISLATLVSGCATCQRYPVPCMVGTAIVVGSVAATIEANRGNGDNRRDPSTIGKVVH